MLVVIGVILLGVGAEWMDIQRGAWTDADRKRCSFRLLPGWKYKSGFVKNLEWVVSYYSVPT